MIQKYLENIDESTKVFEDKVGIATSMILERDIERACKEESRLLPINKCLKFREACKNRLERYRLVIASLDLESKNHLIYLTHTKGSAAPLDYLSSLESPN